MRPGQVGDPERGEAVQRPVPALCPWHPAPGEGQLDVAGHGRPGQQRGVLGDVADLAAQPDPVLGGQRRGVDVVDEHPAVGRRFEAGEQAQHRRLPGAVGAEHRQPLAALHPQPVHPQDGPVAAPVLDPREGQGRDHDAPRCWTDASVALTTNASARSTPA